MQIRLAGLDILVTQHFFNFIDGSSDLEKILSISMPQLVGGTRQACIFDGFSNIVDYCIGANGLYRILAC